MIHDVEKPIEQMMLIQSTYAIFHITIIISVFRSALLRKSYIYLPLKSTKSNKIKNGNFCKVSISCTICIIFFSKAQHPSKKHHEKTCFNTPTAWFLHRTLTWYTWLSLKCFSNSNVSPDIAFTIISLCLFTSIPSFIDCSTVVLQLHNK